MRWLTRWRSRLRALAHRSQVDHELDAELQFYLDETAARYVAAGLAPEEARGAARRSLGSVVGVSEAVRETRGVAPVDRLAQDLRWAWRSVVANPAFSFVVVLTLALGIGANTAVFSLVNALLLRPLPVKNPEQLVVVAVSSSPDEVSSGWNYFVWTEIHRRAQLFNGTVAYFNAPFNLAAAGERDVVDGLWASGSFFDVLGVSATVGRTFTDADDQRGGGPDGPVAMISHRLWQQRFGGTTDVVGRAFTIERVRFSIVGVLPDGFTGPVVGRASDVVIPLGVAPLLHREGFLDHQGAFWLTILARLKPGQTAEAATNALRAAQPEIRALSQPRGGHDPLQRPFVLLSAAQGNPVTEGRVRAERPLAILLAIVAFVLLIACANVANLLLARALARRPELSLRVALGASRWRLGRQLLVECGVLAMLGAVGGLLLAEWSTSLFAQFWSASPNTLVLDLSPDRRVLAFTAAVAIATALIAGAVPALRASRSEPLDALKSRGEAAIGGRMNVASALVVAQIALSLVLVVGAGLFLRTFANLVAHNPGFDPRGVLTVNLSLADAAIAPAHRLAVFADVRDAIGTVAGVERAALADLTPVTDGAMNGEVVVSSGESTSPNRETFFNRVSPGWLSVYRIPLIAGRDFTDADRPGAPHVCMVNAAFARAFLNGGNPVGLVLRSPAGTGLAGKGMEIVGMVADAAYDSLRAPVPPTTYTPFFQLEQELLEATPTDVSLSLRAVAGAPQSLTRGVDAALKNMNPNLAFTFQPLPELVSQSIAQERGLALLSALFGTLALLLAGIGLYGVTSYGVRRRRPELAVRMALGAAPPSVVRLVFVRVFLLVAAGVAIGVASSLWLSRLLMPLLFGLAPNDLPTLTASLVTMAAVGAVAGWLPAYTASRLDPSDVLRNS